MYWEGSIVYLSFYPQHLLQSLTQQVVSQEMLWNGVNTFSLSCVPNTLCDNELVNSPLSFIC